MNNLEQLIEAGNPNGNTLAEIYANIRDKALEEAAVAAWSAGMDAHYKVLGLPADAREVGSRAAQYIRALKRNPNG